VVVAEGGRPERSPRRAAGGGVLKWVLLGVVGLLGVAAVGGLGYVLVGAIQGEPPPTAEFTGPGGIKMVLVPAGSFVMGSPEAEPGRDDDEGPPGEVTISSPFYMAATEVTHGQWVEVMGTPQGKWPAKLRRSKLIPVDSVTWDQANEFCAKLNLKDPNRRSGWAYRLPTEAEWD
jgi:formylglycine-generating enzyme required for sulfatase activity